MQTRLIDPRWRLSGVWIALCLIAGQGSFDCAAQDPAAILEDTITKVVELAEPSVVSIARLKPSSEESIEQKHRAFPMRRGNPRRNMEVPPNELDILPNEFGAGCLISPSSSIERLVLTNLHVVRGGPVYPQFKTDDETELRIRFSDRRSCLAAIIAADPRSDLAVLRLDWDKAGIKPTDFPVFPWEKSTPPKKGQFVILLGNPFAIARDGSASVSWGLISNLTRQPIAVNRNPLFDPEEQATSSMLYRLGAVMQLDARMNLGTSGGPVLNLKGELIGISTSLAAIEGYDQTVGFALPIDDLTRRIVKTLLAGQEVEYGMLGIVPKEISAEEFLRLNTGLAQRTAAYVDAVNPGSPADHVRIVRNDIVVKVEGEPVRSVADLMRLVGLHSPDSIINITLWKTSQRLETVPIRLGKWPVRDDEGIIETKPRYAPWRGLSIDYATARSRYIDPTMDSRRVLVTKVAENSPSHTARLEPGNFITHVNNVAVTTPAEFHREVAKVASGPVTLKLFDDPGTGRAGRVITVRE